MELNTQSTTTQTTEANIQPSSAQTTALNTEQAILLDFTVPSVRNVRCVENDKNSRILNITVTNNGKVFPLNSKTMAARYKIHKPDRTYIYNTVPINDDGTVTIELTGQALAAAGIAHSELQISDSETGAILSTMPFHIIVEKSVVSSKDIESKNESDVINDMIGHLTDYDNPHKIPKSTDVSDGLLSKEDHAKYDAAYAHSQTAHAPAGAEANQNAFSHITVGSTTLSADLPTDTFTLAAGSNITLATDAANDKLTISSKDTIYTHPAKSGYRHIPTGGSSGQILKWSADGTAAWGDEGDPNIFVTGIKGNAESSYRKGNVNLTPDDIGALSVNGVAASASQALRDGEGNIISTTYMKTKTITAATDFNNLKTSGIYMIDAAGCSNAPDCGSVGILIVKYSSYSQQIFLPDESVCASDKCIFTRHWYRTGWMDWEPVNGTLANQITELNTGLARIRNLIIPSTTDTWSEEQFWGYYNGENLYYSTIKTVFPANTVAINKQYDLPSGAKAFRLLDMSMSCYLYGSGIGCAPIGIFDTIAYCWNNQVVVKIPATTVVGNHWAQITAVYAK